MKGTAAVFLLSLWVAHVVTILSIFTGYNLGRRIHSGIPIYAESNETSQFSMFNESTAEVEYIDYNSSSRLALWQPGKMKLCN